MVSDVKCHSWINILVKKENIIMDDKLNKSNENENIIMNKNNGKEIKSITNDEISGNIQIDKEIEEFKNGKYI